MVRSNIEIFLMIKKKVNSIDFIKYPKLFFMLVDMMNKYYTRIFA